MFKNKEYVYCVYQEQSFCKAAEKLHVSQPALSAMIKRVEQQLGMPIFDRKTSPISLTPFGAEYIKSIETVQGLEEHLHNMTYELQTFQSGQLSICAHNLAADFFIPEMIAAFMKQYPHIKLNVIGTNTLRSKNMLDSGEIDLFFSSKPLSESEYVRLPIFRERLVLAVPKEFSINEIHKDMALTRKDLRRIFHLTGKCVNLNDFQELPFILPNTGNYLRSCTDILFREAHFEPQIALEVEESAIAPNLAKYGVGATLISHLLIERRDFQKYFYVYNLNSAYAERIGFIYYRRGAYVTPAMREFLKLAEQMHPFS